MDCKINVIKENDLPIIKSLKDYYGSDQNRFEDIKDKVLNASDGYKLSDAFNNWYEETYNGKLDLNVSDENDIIYLRDKIIEYYNIITPSIKTLNANVVGYNYVTKYNYNNNSDREECKQLMTNYLVKLEADYILGLSNNFIEERSDRVIHLSITRINNKLNELQQKEELTDDDDITIKELKRLLNYLHGRLSYVIKEYNAKVKDSDKKVQFVELTTKDISKAFKKTYGMKPINEYAPNPTYHELKLKNYIKALLFNNIAFTKFNKSFNQLNNDDRKVIVKAAKEQQSLIDLVGGNAITPKNKTLIALYFEINNVEYKNIETGKIINKEEYNNLSIKEKENYTQFNSFIEELKLNNKLSFIKTFDSNSSTNNVLAENAQLTEEEEVELDEHNSINKNDDYIAIEGTWNFDHSGSYSTAMMHMSADVKVILSSIPKLKTFDTNDSINLNNADTDNILGIDTTMDTSECASMLFHNTNKENVNTFVESILNIAKNYPNFGGFAYLYNLMQNDSNLAYLLYNVFAKPLFMKIQLQESNGERKPIITNKRSDNKNALIQILLNNVRNNIMNVEPSYIQHLLSIATNKSNENLNEKIINITKAIKTFYPTIDEKTIEIYITSKINPNTIINTLSGIIKRNPNTIINTLSGIIKRITNEIQNVKDQYNTNKENGDYYKDYLTNNVINNTIHLAIELEKYQIAPNIEINSINALGNQSSDVINTSYTSGLNSVFNSKEALGNFLKRKRNHHQYKYSNILFEQQGLITLEDKLNEKDGSDIFSIRLFDGVKNFDTNQGATYAKLSKPDYRITVLTAFHENDDVIKNPNVASYFLRTPSDAPKNYTMTAPKYSTKDLISIDQNSRELLNNKYNAITQHINQALLVDSDTSKKINSIKTKSIKEFLDPIAKEIIEPIYLPNSLSLIEDFKQHIISKLNEENHLNKRYKYVINKNHKVYKMLFNMFSQEILNAIMARDYMVHVNKDGSVSRDGNNKIIFKENINNENPGNSLGLETTYHYIKTITTLKDNGIEEQFTGKVFTSDRFILCDDDGNVRNYGQEIIDECIDFIYGGDKAISLDDDGDVKFSEHQLEIINAKLSEYISDLVIDAMERLNDLKGMGCDSYLTFDAIAEFMLNYNIMYNNFNELFEGDSKFYKDAQTFLKRAKEGQGAGSPFGNADVIRGFADANIADNIKKYTPTIILDDGSEYKIPIKNKFTAITVKNTQTHNETTLNVIKNQLIKNGVDESEADRLMEGFKGTKVNDAQSYITFEEWVRRITLRGQFNKYKNVIKAIVENKDLNKETIPEYIQVQKNFYYALDQRDNTNIEAPNQIKNAEFVLVPQFIQGTELAEVYDFMVKHGIDQLNTEETTKAGKCDIVEIFDVKTGHIKNLSKLDDEIPNRIHLHDYTFLYTQQETPQHMGEDNKAGIQIVKKVIDNIDPGDPRYVYKERFVKLFCKNIKESAKSLFDELNLENKDGILQVNLDGTLDVSNMKNTVFYEKLKAEINRLGYDSNLLDYVTIDPTNNEVTIMPNFMSIVGNKLENIAQAMFNNAITRQKLPGFHAAQITNVGFYKFGKQKSDVGYSGRLRYHTNDKGEYVDYIEIMLPKSAFPGLKLTERDEDGNIRYKTDDELLKELEEEGLDRIIGYRIPTEGKQSISIFKVKEFLPDNCGSTIVVPDEWVAQTGSDFDIDSIYGIMHPTYLDNEGHIKKYKYNEDAEDAMTKDHRDAAIVDCMIDILAHPKTLEEIVATSNFRDIIAAREKIDENGNTKNLKIRRDNRSVYNILDQIDFQNDAISGMALKAISVSRDNFCSVCNTVKPTIRKSLAISVNYKLKDIIPSKTINKKAINDTIKTLKNRYDKDCLKFNKHIKDITVENIDDVIVTITHDKIGWSGDNKNIIGRYITIYSSQTTAHQLDVIKEGPVPNVNEFTFNVYKTFPDLGIDFDTTIAFMAQKGVKRIVNNFNNNKSIYNSNFAFPVERTIRDIAAELMPGVNKWTNLDDIYSYIDTNYSNELQNYGIKSIIEARDLPLSFEDLRDKCSSPLEGISGLIYDLVIVMQYQKFKELADIIGDIARVSNPDKFGAKQTIYSTNKIYDDILELCDTNKQLVESGLEPNLYVGKDKTFILNSIYPDIDNGIYEYLNSEIESSYPIMNTFLKTTTISSLLVNRSLFKTQNSNFRGFINGLQKVLPKGVSMNETMYKSFEKYIISKIYNDSLIISMPIRYDVKEKALIYPDNNTTKYGKLSERARIYGYNYSTTPTDEQGNPIKINPVNPTQEDIEKFIEFTPAQKINYIQTNFQDIGIFNKFEVNLHNTTKIKGKKAGFQTIEFAEDTISKEEIYLQLSNTFNNGNPLLKIAVYDLIKYAFIVEGYTISKKGISKIIPNNLLYQPFGVGLGIVEDVANTFNKFIEDLEYHRIDTDLEYSDYIRSNADIAKIPLRRIKEHDNKYFKSINKTIVQENKIATSVFTGVYYINNINDSKIFKTLKDTYRLNNDYVRLIIKNKENLYKIYNIGNGIVLIPLNILEPFEHGNYSIKDDNKNVIPYSQHKQIIQYLSLNSKLILASYIEQLQAIEIDKVQIDRTNTKNTNKNKKIDYTDEALMLPLIDKVNKFYSNNPLTKTMYLFHNGLDKYITESEATNGQSISLPIDYNGSVKTIPVDIYKLSNRAKEIITYYLINPQLNPYVNNNLTKKPKNYVKYENIIIEAVDLNIKNVQNMSIFAVTPKIDEGLKMSSITEGKTISTVDVAADIFTTMNHAANLNNEDAINILQSLRDKKIRANGVSLEANKEIVINYGNKYFTKEIDSLLTNIKYFYNTENGLKGINDPNIVSYLREHPEKVNDFLKVILATKAMLNNNAAIFELDISKTDDEDLRRDLHEIQDKLKELINADNEIVKNAILNFGEYLKDFSTNPLIQNGIINVINSFYSVSSLNAWIGDLQESPNTLIQVITKIVTNDLFAKEQVAKNRVLDFRKHVQTIMNKARSNGYSIDLNKFINDNGQFKQTYSEEFKKELFKLKQAYKDSEYEFSLLRNKKVNQNDFYNDEELDIAFEKVIRAKYDYDKFKSDYIDQEIVDEYYIKKLEAEKHMIDNHMFIYARFKRLQYERNQILSLDDIDTNPTSKVKLDLLNNHLKVLKSKYQKGHEDIYSGIEKTRRYDNPSLPPNVKINISRYDAINDSYEDSLALVTYIINTQRLENKYKEKNAKYGFYAELKRVLHILKTSTNKEEIEKAENWLSSHTTVSLKDEQKEEVNKAFKAISTESNNRIKEFIKAKQLKRDEFGEIDARDLSDKDIEIIKRNQLSDFKIDSGTIFSDKFLIKALSQDNTIYHQFYTKFTVGGVKPEGWNETVTEINNILKKYVNNSIDHNNPVSQNLSIAKLIDMYNENKDELINDLKELRKLYDKLEASRLTRKDTVTPEELAKVSTFIKDNVDFDLTEDEKNVFDKFASLFQSDVVVKPLWNSIIYNIKTIKHEDGSSEIVSTHNSFLFGSPKPKKGKEHKFIDEAKTNAVATLRKYYTKKPTKYYYLKLQEMQGSTVSEEDFKTWWENNHIYNPFTLREEPIDCWMSYQYKNKDDVEYTPNWENSELKVADEYQNQNHIKNASLLRNYKYQNGDSKYDNPELNKLNQYEEELKQYLQDVLYKYNKTKSGTRYLDEGYLPSRYKTEETNVKLLGKELLKSVGWYVHTIGKEQWYDNIGYEYDKIAGTPMLTLLDQKKIEIALPKPIKRDDETDEEFIKREHQYQQDVETLKANNAEAHKNAIDKDWLSVIEAYILESNRFNAIQDNKYMLFYGRNIIANQTSYISKYGFGSDLKPNSLNNDEYSLGYKTKPEKQLLNQYDTWLRRVLYNQWKQPHGMANVWAARLQSLTSAQYMMMNIRGGIANLITGNFNVFAERLANEYFDKNSWSKSESAWMASVPDQLANMDSETSSSLFGAIIKSFDIIEYDEHTGKSRIVENSINKAFNRLNGFLYSPQTIGENYMQNKVLFSVLYSNRVFEENGKIVFMNKAEYLRNCDKKALLAVLPDNLKAKFEQYVEDIKKDANKLKDFAWYKKDFVYDFLKKEVKDEQIQKEYVKLKKILLKEGSKTFEEAPTIISQLELNEDKRLGVKAGSILEKYNENPLDVNAAIKMLADVKGRVISINKKIHGVYDKLGQAQLEKTLLGSLVMQYHKHLYPGLLKRLRVKGMYNEQRGTIEKGSYISALSYLTRPIRDAYTENLNDGQVLTLKGLKNIFKHLGKSIVNVQLNWGLLPEYEKANIRRSLGDLIGILVMAVAVVALKGIDDDDKEESILYNLALYEADRVASELALFTPQGMVTEVKTLWSKPIAAQSMIEDIFTSGRFLIAMLLDEDFDPTYQTGRFAGENKLTVRLKRRIPVYRGIHTLSDIANDNSYYKRGETVLDSYIIESIIDDFEEDEE